MATFCISKAGGMSELGFYKDGKDHGNYIDYHPNGQVHLEYHFNNGKMHGV